MLSCDARLHMPVLCFLVTYAGIVLLGYNAGCCMSNVKTMVCHTSYNSYCEVFVISSLFEKSAIGDVIDDIIR